MHNTKAHKLWLAGSLVFLALTSCAAVVDVDFESYATGPLGSPWVLTGNAEGTASTASVVQTDDHGKALLLHGDASSPNFLIAALGFSSSASTVSAEFSIKPDEGASFVWSLSGAGSSIGARRIRLQREPGSNSLVASTSPSGNTTCGTLPSKLWSRIALVVHTGTPQHTFDVRIDGAPTACTGIATGLSAPFDGVSVMDASNEGWGGDVRFDDIKVSTL